MIINEEKFGKMYKYAKKVLSENEFYLKLLEQCYSDEKNFNFIVLSNDIHEIAPVETFVKLYKNEIKEYEKGDEIENEGIRKALGAFFGYIFKEKLGRKVMRSVRVGKLGISKATIFTKK